MPTDSNAYSHHRPARLYRGDPSTSFKAAIVIPYKNKAERFQGRFVLGFNEAHMAVKLAPGIAGHVGMPAVGQMDEMATDILFEFMNTVAG